MVGNRQRQWFGPEHCGGCAESGDQLVATARNPRRLDDLVNKFGERVRAVSLDVADESAAQAAVQVALDAFGRLDVVVNNAGFGDTAPFEQLSAERFKAVIDTNFYGVATGAKVNNRTAAAAREGIAQKTVFMSF